MKINLIIERLFTYFEVDTNIALANKLGVSATTLSNWKTRNTIDYDLLFTKCEGANFNWIFFGIGEMHLKDYADKPPPNVVIENKSSGCDMCREKEKRIDALERIIQTQAKLINKYEEEKSSFPNEQKRKVG